MKRKIGLLFATLMTSLLALVNVKVEAKPEVSPAPQTLEVKDVLEEGAIEGSGRVVRRVASPAANHKASQAYMQVTAPTADGKVNVRFVAGIDSAEYAEAQLKLEMFDGNTSKGSYAAKVTTAYTAMVVNGENQTAAQVFGEGYNYIVAYTMKNMPRESWENGFKASVGLKLAGEETFTETAAEEVKNVKAAIMADNHLVFSWRPYNGNYSRVSWENNFLASEMSNLDTSLSENHDAIVSSIKQNINVEITDEEGTVYNNNKDWIDCVGGINTRSLNLQFTGGIQTQAQEYSIKVTINLADGRVLTGYSRYVKLDDAQNAVVEEIDGNFILRFDEVANASSYSYQIIGTDYESPKMAADPLGTTLASATLDKGTYDIVIIAEDAYYMPSTKTFSGILVVEKAAVIYDGTDKYEFEIYHDNGEYEFAIRFKAKDPADVILEDSKITDVKLTKNGEDYYEERMGFVGGERGEIVLRKNIPYYNEDDGYYYFGYDGAATPNMNQLFGIDFIVETAAGNIYSINLFYIIEESMAAIGSSVSETQDKFKLAAQEYYTQELTSELSEYPESDYSPENWVIMNEIYNNALADIAAATVYTQLKSIYNNAASKMESVPKANPAIEGVTAVDASSNPGGAWEAVDNNKGSRWIASSTNAGEYITLDLGKEYSISSLWIFWEGANAYKYDVMVSTNNIDWNLACSYTDPNKGLHAREDTLTFDAVKARYVKILCQEAGTGYNYSIYEIDVYAAA